MCVYFEGLGPGLGSLGPRESQNLLVFIVTSFILTTWSTCNFQLKTEAHAFWVSLGPSLGPSLATPELEHCESVVRGWGLGE